MNQQRRRGSPAFYKGVAIVFFVFAAIFVAAAVRQHSWYYWAFAIITILNGLMSLLKSYVVREI